MADVVFFPGALQALFNSPSGGVARDLARRALRVETQAKLNLSGAFPPPSAPGESPHLRSGRLRASVTWELGEDAIGLYAAVGTDVPYGRYLEDGTDTIAPRPWLKPALAAAGY